jgi:hypothetical protein
MSSFGPNIPPHEALRWSIDAAGAEFQVTKMTLRKYLTGIGARPDAAGCFSTPQITAALYGDLHAARVRLARAQYRRISLANAATRGALVDKALLRAMFSRVADSMVSRITASNLSPDEKTDLLKELSSVPVSIDGIAVEQSRLPHGDGEDDLDDDFNGEDEDDAPRSGKARKPAKTHFRRKPGFVKTS